MELTFILGLVAAVSLPLVVFVPGSRRRRSQVVELRDFTDCLIDSAMTDPQRLVVVDFLLAIATKPEIRARLAAVATAAKARFAVEHAEINFLVAKGDMFIAGDTLVAGEVARPDSYCRLTLSGRPVVIKDSLANLMVADNPHVRDVRSYLGVPLVVREEVVGALCVYDSEPREWTAEEERELTEMAGEVTSLLAGGERVAGGI